jgi:hypothetical protein
MTSFKDAYQALLQRISEAKKAGDTWAQDEAEQELADLIRGSRKPEVVFDPKLAQAGRDE